jgi:NADPH-dependent ferric siderophore reductase
MKKKLPILIPVLLLLALGLMGIKTFSNYQARSPEIITLTCQQENQTVYSLLDQHAKQKSLTLKTKQYAFGILVEAIGNQANSPDKAWIYFVNGVAGDVAADKKILKPKDKVEWKYIKPSF